MVQIANHSHCVMCGRAVNFGEKTCSPECVSNLEMQNRRRKNMMLMIYGAMALSILLILLNGLGILR